MIVFAFAVLFFLFLFIAFIYTVVQFAYFLFESWIIEQSDNLGIKHSFHHYEVFTAKLGPSYKAILTEKFEFYKTLSDKKKLVFESRVAKILSEKTFETRENLALTDEMKVLITATIVHLTFGLSKYRLKNFRQIIIYPTYYLSSTGNYHLGEVTSKGVVMLSWEHYKEGYQSLTDKKNLGLHEMAHALFNQNIFFDKDIDTRFTNYYEEWKELSYPLLLGLRKNNTQTVLRDYALVNMHEFFSVSIECFFEAPQQLKEELPHLYQVLKKMLNQDPAEKTIN